MTASPRLSIVIPTLNRLSLARRALESALAQTADDIEVLISDNGSNDGTAAWLAGVSDRRLRKFHHAQTISAQDHGNFLIDQARGEYFVGLSDDDWLEPDFAARVLALLDRHPGLPFLYTGCLTHYAQSSVPALCGPERESGCDFLAAFFAGEREVCWCAAVSRLADLRAIGPIPPGRIFGDMYLWTRLARLGDVGCVALPLSHYSFITADNVSTGTPVTAWALETRLLADEVLQAWPPGDQPRIERLTRDMQAFVARSSANQFVWNVVRGAARSRLWRSLPALWPLLRRSPQVWPRLLVALLLPHAWTRTLVLVAAKRRSRQR
ncbi:MAG: glycosyltransferase family 2 protein [Pelomonas sp.]|nr:glycosyltransferase family 2 protein [Roseateles sp.]